MVNFLARSFARFLWKSSKKEFIWYLHLITHILCILRVSNIWNQGLFIQFVFLFFLANRWWLLLALFWCDLVQACGVISWGPATAPSQPPLRQQAQLTSAGLPGSGPCLALSPSLRAVRSAWPTPAASPSFPGFIACRGFGNTSQVRQWSAFFTAGSLPAKRESSSCSIAHLWAAESLLEASQAARAQSTWQTWAEFLPPLSGGHPLHTGNPPCSASHLRPEGKHHLSRFLHRSCSALVPFPQMRAPRKVSRAWNQLTRVKSRETPDRKQEPRVVSDSWQKSGWAEHSPLWISGARLCPLRSLCLCRRGTPKASRSAWSSSS